MLWVWFLGMLIGGVSVEGVNVISIVEASKGIGKKGISFVITVDSVYELSLEEANGYEVNLEDGELMITASGRTSADLILPQDVDTIKINTVSGDLDLSFNVPFQGKEVSINTISGNVKISGESFSSLRVVAVSGDILIDADPDNARKVQLSISTISGDILLNEILPGVVTLNTVNGDVVIKSKGRVFEDSLYSYKVSTVTGDVEVVEDIKGLVNISKGADVGKKSTIEQEKEVKKVGSITTDLPFLSYNRVNGLLIFPSIKDEDDWGRYIFAGGYGTASNRFYYFVDLEKYVPVGKTNFGAGFGIYDFTQSSEPWKGRLQENSWQSILMKDDLLDFYRTRGFNVYLGFRISELAARFSYVQEHRYSEKVNTNFSIFKREEDFRENLTLVEGMNRFLQLRASFKSVGITSEYYIDAPQDDEVIRVYGNFEDKTKFRYFDLYHNISLGYSSSAGFPYSFTLGGPTTLPGYTSGSITTQKFIIANEYIVFPVKFLDFILGFYGGYAEDKFYADILGGLNIFSGLGVYVCRDREASNGIKYYLRFNKRI
ncbi:MAG: DUF4097 family beta strand repeat-containing protein [Candidatus Hydrothermia bacterium]|nr:DUF4097 family beta strand repeat-containing protein [Candidatus Hydrothermia bacterium]